MFDLPVPAQKMVHVHAGAEELGRVYQATLPINSGMAAVRGRGQGDEAGRCLGVEGQASRWRAPTI